MIEVQGVVKRFGDILAVNGLSFDVNKGEVYGLLGPNGAGKTTTLNIMCTLASPDEGSIQISGLDTVKQASEVKHLIGVVFQEGAAYEKLTAIENLVFFAQMHGMEKEDAKERAHELLKIVGLLDRGKDLVETFSGGMKQRLNMALGLIHRPDILLLDEPTMGLDPDVRRRIWKIIEGLKEENLTIVLSTHYAEEADVLCDTIGILNEGKMVVSGNPGELKKKYNANTLEDVFLISIGELEGGKEG